MLRITAVALATLALTTIMPMGVVGKSNETGTGHAAAPSNLPNKDAILGPSLWRRSCQPGQYLAYGNCQNCGQGYYCSGYGERSACPAGTYNDQLTSQRSSDCKPILCGHQPSGGNAYGIAATGQAQCGMGYFSKGGSTTCTVCPVGMFCNALATCVPKPCVPGTYADVTGSAEKCKNCPAGTFNNSFGNIACCNCCAGWYSEGDDGHTSCERCPNIGGVQPIGITGPIGSGIKDKCTAYTGIIGQERPAQICSQILSLIPGICPPTSGNTPSGAMKRSAMTTCPYGTTRCEVKSGRGGFECVDTLKSLETCGGCDNDCSLLEGTNEVQCLKGLCVIKSCSAGYELSPRGDGISRGGLDVGMQCIAKKKKNHARHASGL